MMKLENWIKNNFAENIFSQKLGIARSLVALGTLLTLIFNPISNIIYQTSIGIPQNPILLENNFANSINLFLLIGIENASYMRG